MYPSIVLLRRKLIISYLVVFRIFTSEKQPLEKNLPLIVTKKMYETERGKTISLYPEKNTKSV